MATDLAIPFLQFDTGNLHEREELTLVDSSTEAIDKIERLTKDTPVPEKNAGN